jgi:putative membrane protein
MGYFASMAGLVVRWIVSAIALGSPTRSCRASRSRASTAAAAAAAIGIVNAVVRPIVLLLTLPPSIVTLGPCWSPNACVLAASRSCRGSSCRVLGRFFGDRDVVLHVLHQRLIGEHGRLEVVTVRY